jgi:hypothetical protein
MDQNKLMKVKISLMKQLAKKKSEEKAAIKKAYTDNCKDLTEIKKTR